MVSFDLIYDSVWPNYNLVGIDYGLVWPDYARYIYDPITLGMTRLWLCLT